MATHKEIQAVADVLADDANGGYTAEEVAKHVWEAVERCRRRAYAYVIVGQDRSKAKDNGRAYWPTWAKGPFHTAAEASAAARKERIRVKDSTGQKVKVMGVKLFDVESDVDPDTLEEVLAG